VDDTPRAEQRAALLSLDRALLDEIMGAEGADEATTESLAEVLAIRRGTAPRRRARSADELAVLIDRAGDVSHDEARERVADPAEWTRGDPLIELLTERRVVGIAVPTANGPELRLILTEAYGRYAAALGAEAVERVHTGAALVERPAAEVIPDELRAPTLTSSAARREVLARWLGIAGPVSLDEVAARYAFPPRWVTERLEGWQRDGKLVRGFFGGDRTVERWCSRRVLEHARRRALAIARRQVSAVGVEALVSLLQRWQHLDPRDRLEGSEGTAIAVRQLAGIARPADAWERDYLPLRVGAYDPATLTRLTQSGEIVWVGAGAADERGDQALTAVRFVPRGTLGRWAQPGRADASDRPLGDAARGVLAALASHGASFLGDLQAATGLTTLAIRDALRELSAAGLVTNDSADALREVIRFRPLLGRPRRDEPDPTRWLPADFTPSPGRPIVQRRANLRRLPKWRRPDLPGGRDGWVGRWSLVATPGTLGVEDEDARAKAVARQWLDRYGVVARDWWRRERPAVGWRAIYRELKRLEFRGEVRRGYFVRGLAGAQFAAAAIVDALRDAAADPDAPVVVMAASDPANAFALPLPPEERPALARPRGRGALLVTRRGRIILAVEGRGRRVAIAPEATADDVADAVAALTTHLTAPSPFGGRRRDLVVETIDGAPAARSPHAPAFAAAGYRSDGARLARPAEFLR
jgi:ATP-dependent Lhr-like helicase